MKKISTPQTFIFFGRSGSGKGTQVEYLMKYLESNDSKKAKIIYIETGNLVREFAKNDSYSAKLSKEIIESGGLLPEFIPIWAWAEVMIKNITGPEHLIIEGASRRISEAKVLKDALEFYKRDNIKVVYINVSRDWAVERLLARKRKDDSLSGITQRQDWFDQNVIPAIEFFKRTDGINFIDVKGEQSREKVHADLVKAAFE